jgi:uncharacterized protein YdiU (UPF0061 family)
MAAGFVHGVLNTDNINITGESFDYGPWRFLPAYDLAFTAAYFDHGGLYAFGRQPETLMWNLARLGGCLLPFAEKSALEAALAPFGDTLHQSLAAAMVRRLGVESRGPEADARLGSHFFGFAAASGAPFEQIMFDWFGGLDSAGRAGRSPSAPLYETPDFAEFRAVLSEYGAASWAQQDRAYFARPTPCTMLIEEVEAIWAPIAERDDWSLFHAKLASIREMGEAITPGPTGG